MSWRDIEFITRNPMAGHDAYYYKLVANGIYSELMGNNTVYLPKELIWQDEFSWDPVAQAYEYSVEGNFLIQESKKKKGRHITLVGHNDMAWIDREDMKILVAMRDITGLKMTLTFETRDPSNNDITTAFEYTVMFRHQDTALEYTLVKNFDQYENDALYIINAIRFMEVLPNEQAPSGG